MLKVNRAAFVRNNHLDMFVWCQPFQCTNPGYHIAVATEKQSLVKGITGCLQQHGDSIKITAQSGWSVSELGYCFAGFHNPDRTRSAFYELYSNTTAEEFIAQVESGMIPAMEAHELTVTTEADEPIGDYQTHIIKGDAVNVYLAYRAVGNSLLGIYAEDSSGANITSVLTPLLNSVADHQIEY